MSKYERIAPRGGGTDEYLLLKETLEKVERGSLSESLEQKIDSLLEEFRLSREQRSGEIDKISKAIASISVEVPEPVGVPQPEPIDVQGLVEKVYNLTSVKSTYTFEVKRDSSGRLKEIVATPNI